MAPSDATESAVQQIAQQGMTGAPEWAQRLFNLIMAVDEDASGRHEAEVKMAKTVAQAHDKRLLMLEGWKADSELNCEARIQRLIEAEHEARHAAHMDAFHVPKRADDPPGSDYRKRRGRSNDIAEEDEEDARKVWVMWGIGQKLLVIITATGSAVITALLTHWLMGG